MNPTVQAVLTILSKLAPTVAGLAGPRGVIIGEIVAQLPTLIEAGTEVLAEVRDIMATLQADPTVSQAELDQIDAVNAAVDKAFDDAEAKALADDAAAGQA